VPGTAPTPQVVVVVVGPSESWQKCMTVGSGVYCPPDAGYKRVNRDYSDFPQDFRVKMFSEHRLCVMCKRDGWAMDLQLECHLRTQ